MTISLCGALDDARATIELLWDERMVQAYTAQKVEPELPLRAGYYLAASILFMNAAFFFVFYYLSGVIYVPIIFPLIDIVLIMLLLFENNFARMVVLIRCCLGLFFGFILMMSNWVDIFSIEPLVIQVIYSAALIYLLSFRTRKKQIWVGSVCLVVLTLYNLVAVFLVIQKTNFT